MQRALGQTVTLHLYQTYSSFSNLEKAEWTAFENNWNYVEYTELKQKIKKLNCKNCGSYYADIYIEINATGELTAVLFRKGKICGQPISSDKIINAFEKSLKAQTINYLKKQAIYCQI